MLRVFLGGIVFAAALAYGSRCSADPWAGPSSPPTATEEQEAQRLYERGVACVQGGEPALGIEYLGQSYEKSGSFLPLYSIGVTLHSTREYVRAYGALRQLLHDHPELPDDLKKEATARLEDSKKRVGVLIVEGLPPPKEISLVLGKRSVVDGGERPLHTSVIPGRVDLEGERTTDGAKFRWSGSVGEGKTVAVRPRWRSLVTEQAVTSTPLDEAPRDEDDSTFYESGWFWVAVGSVVVVGAAIAVGIAVTEDDPIEPHGSNVLRL